MFLRYVAIVVSIFIAMYLMFVYVLLEFDSFKWAAETRFAYLFFSIIFSILFCVFYTAFVRDD